MKVMMVDVAPRRGEKRPQEDRLDDDDPSRAAWIIDGGLSDDCLKNIQEIRQSLPLDTKRPTVKRRFFTSAAECPTLRDDLQRIVEQAIVQGARRSSDNLSDHIEWKAHVFSYMRFLEYEEVGMRLDPHSDGNKICDDTGLKSTHTMLIYLSDCKKGGETILYRSSEIVEAVKPRLGRILLFPHETLHAGAKTVDIPKTCLRAEVSLHWNDAGVKKQQRYQAIQRTMPSTHVLPT